MDKVKYNKKEYPVRISYYALKHLAAEQGKTLAEIGDVIGNTDMYEPLLFYGLQAGAKAEKQELDLKMDDMELVLDECFFEFIDIIERSFPKDRKGAAEKPKQNQAAKKPATKKKS